MDQVYLLILKNRTTPLNQSTDSEGLLSWPDEILVQLLHCIANRCEIDIHFVTNDILVEVRGEVMVESVEAEFCSDDDEVTFLARNSPSGGQSVRDVGCGGFDGEVFGDAVEGEFAFDVGLKDSFLDLFGIGQGDDFKFNGRKFLGIEAPVALHGIGHGLGCSFDFCSFDSNFSGSFFWVSGVELYISGNGVSCAKDWFEGTVYGKGESVDAFWILEIVGGGGESRGDD